MRWDSATNSSMECKVQRSQPEGRWQPFVLEPKNRLHVSSLLNIIIRTKSCFSITMFSYFSTWRRRCIRMLWIRIKSINLMRKLRSRSNSNNFFAVTNINDCNSFTIDIIDIIDTSTNTLDTTWYPIPSSTASLICKRTSEFFVRSYFFSKVQSSKYGIRQCPEKGFVRYWCLPLGTENRITRLVKIPPSRYVSDFLCFIGKRLTVSGVLQHLFG